MYRACLGIAKWLCVGSAVNLLIACADNVISIESEDSVTFTTVETSFPIYRERNLDVKLRGSRTSGDYTQSVPDGKMILIDDIQIRGPVDVSGSTDLTYASVSIGTDNVISEHDDDLLRGSVYVGVAQTNMDLTLVHQGTTHATSDRTTEMYMQVGLLFRVLPSLYGGGTWAASLGPNLTGISELDLKLSYAVFSHLELMGGYRWLRYDYYVEDDESVIHIDFRGPFVGLSVPF